MNLITSIVYTSKYVYNTMWLNIIFVLQDASMF